MLVFVQSLPHSAADFEENIPTIKALIAVVNTLADNGETYPTNAEIDTLFSNPPF